MKIKFIELLDIEQAVLNLGKEREPGSEPQDSTFAWTLMRNRKRLENAKKAYIEEYLEGLTAIHKEFAIKDEKGNPKALLINGRPQVQYGSNREKARVREKSLENYEVDIEFYVIKASEFDRTTESTNDLGTLYDFIIVDDIIEKPIEEQKKDFKERQKAKKQE